MTTHTLALVVALFAAAAHADDFIYNKREAKRHPETKWIRYDFAGFKDGKLTFDRGEPTVDFAPKSGTIGTFSSNVEGIIPSYQRYGTLSLSLIESVKFDGVNDWLTVVMKNGDVIRGEAESLNPNTLRLKGVERAVRMSAVKEIVATEPPREPAAE